MNFKEPTRWELFTDGFDAFMTAWEDYGTSEFWEDISCGWYDDYIYPYDDIFYGHIPSKERVLRIGS